MRHLANRRSWLIPFMTFIIGTTLGSGIIWKWAQFKQEEKKYALEASQHANDIMREQSDILQQLMDLKDAHQKEGSDRKKRDIEIQMQLLYDEFYDFEYKLAVLEKRSPRDISLHCFLDFTPPSPPGRIKVEVASPD